MRRSDATVAGVLLSLKSPILSTEWSIRSKDDSKIGKKLKQYVESALFRMPERTWKEFLREALTYFDFGFSAFEIIWGYKNGELTVVDLSPRIQNSILRWRLSDGRRGISQIISNDLSNQTSYEIPIDKLLVFTNDKEGSDYTGRSMLRPAYGHWFYKNLLYKLGAMAIERYGVGIPVITIPEGSTDDERNEAIEMGKQLRSNEKAYIIKPSDKWGIEILTPNGAPLAGTLENLIDIHDRMISISVLAQFMNLGSTDSGSRALSQDQTDFFTQVVEEKAFYIAEQVNSQVINRIIFNAFAGQIDFAAYIEQDLLPKLTFAPLGDVDYTEQATVMKTLYDMGIVKSENIPMNEHIRIMFDLPELTKEEKKEMEEQEEIPKEETKEDTKEESKEEDQKKNEKFSEQKYWRELTQWENKKSIQLFEETFAEIQTKTSILDYTANAISAFIKRIPRLLESQDLSSIKNANIISKPQIKSLIKETTIKAYENGKKTASEELGVDRLANTRVQNQLLDYEIDEQAEMYKQKIEKEIKDTTRDGLANEVIVTAIIASILLRTSEKAKIESEIISNHMNAYGLGTGRMYVFENNINKIKGYYRSEILDSRTCDTCMSLDGTIITADDPMSKLNDVHYRCRGSWFPILYSEMEGKKLEDLGKVGIPSSLAKTFDTVGGVPSTNRFTPPKN